MPRFFVQNEAVCENRIMITGDDSRHIARALRMAVGDEVFVCDMNGVEYRCRLSKIRDEESECEILEVREGKSESPVEITLFMAFPKGDKLETVIQKAVELGASRIVPFESSRCIKRPKADKAERLNLRFTRIAEEAAKQCGRQILPKVSEPCGFDAAIRLASEADLPLFCYEGEDTVSIKDAFARGKDARTVSVVIGCEGGFSISEAESAVKAGLISVGLGPRMLRCETAPVVALSQISYFFEL